MPIIRVRSFGSVNVERISEAVDGITVAPDAPSSSRAAISTPGLPEYAVSTEASPKQVAPISSSRLRPIRSPTPPISTSRLPRAKLYASAIHSSSVADGCIVLTRLGMARLSTVLSMPSRSAAMEQIASVPHLRRAGT